MRGTSMAHRRSPRSSFVSAARAALPASLRSRASLRARAASIDSLDFYAPILVTNIVVYQAAINHVGRSSIEVGVRVLAEDPRAGTVRHTCTAYLTAVHVGPDGRPRPLPPLVPQTPGEQQRWQDAEVRRAQRQRRSAPT
ncbi:MAG: acyl-CoA thioesterase, partial [bacterium]